MKRGLRGEHGFLQATESSAGFVQVAYITGLIARALQKPKHCLQRRDWSFFPDQMLTWARVRGQS